MRHRLAPLLSTLFALWALFAATPALAWWNADWPQRTKLVLDTRPAGLAVNEALTSVPLALRLHSGNFDFVAARPDGGDLRLVAGDDKTLLPFRIERWDSVNELAVVWVLLPALAADSEQNTVYAYFGNERAAAEPGSATGLDVATRLALHFSKPEGAVTAAMLEPNGLLAGALKLAGTPVVLPAGDATTAAAGSAWTVSLWLRADATDRGTVVQQGPLSLALAGGRVQARIGTLVLDGPVIRPATWTHLALVLGEGGAALYVDGAPAARGDGATPALDGPLRLGEGLTGALDELQAAAASRSAPWLAVAARTQGIGGAGLTATLEQEGQGDGGGQGGYMGILVKNLTVDAWVVIVICGLMLVVAVWVMAVKVVMLQRADVANRGFLKRFRVARDDLLRLADGDAAQHRHSSLFRLYAAGVRELDKRDVGRTERRLSGASLDAVKAAVDADMVRETQRLNGQMVLLTIAISGGPFLGLLGTVVGVMITFAAIAAAGDVNVNAIAPGIAAALLATVAGLAVAIPALFGYNYLAVRIKNISADMQIFIDEFITRVAEEYGAR